MAVAHALNCLDFVRHRSLTILWSLADDVRWVVIYPLSYALLVAPKTPPN
jgi:hypothetical protein